MADKRSKGNNKTEPRASGNSSARKNVIPINGADNKQQHDEGGSAHGFTTRLKVHNSSDDVQTTATRNYAQPSRGSGAAKNSSKPSVSSGAAKNSSKPSVSSSAAKNASKPSASSSAAKNASKPSASRGASKIVQMPSRKADSSWTGTARKPANSQSREAQRQSFAPRTGTSGKAFKPASQSEERVPVNGTKTRLNQRSAVQLKGELSASGKQPSKKSNKDSKQAVAYIGSNGMRAEEVNVAVARRKNNKKKKIKPKEAYKTPIRTAAASVVKRETPEMIQYRAERRQRRRKLMLRWTVLLVTFAGIAACVYVLLNSVFLIDSIEVMGMEADVDKEKIIEMSGIECGTSIFLADTETARKNIQEDAFMVAEVVKDYPNKVVITIRERQEYVCVEAENSYAVIDIDGYVLYISNSYDTIEARGFLLINGMDCVNFAVGSRITPDFDYRFEAMRDLVEAIHETGTADVITEIDMANPYAVRMMTTVGTSVYLGAVHDRKLKWYDENSCDLLKKRLLLLEPMLTEVRIRGLGSGEINLASSESVGYVPDKSEATQEPVTTAPVTSPNTNPPS